MPRILIPESRQKCRKLDVAMEPPAGKVQMTLSSILCLFLIFGIRFNKAGSMLADVTSEVSCNRSQWPVSVLCLILPQLHWKQFVLVADQLTERASRRLVSQLIRSGGHARLFIVKPEHGSYLLTDEVMQMYGNVIVSCGGLQMTKKVLRSASDNNFISLYFHWLVLVPEVELATKQLTQWEEFLKFFDSLIITKPQNLALVWTMESGYEIFKIVNGFETSWKRIQSVKFGSKEAAGQDSGQNETAIPIYHQSLEGNVLTMAIIHDPPYTTLRETPNSGYVLSGIDSEAFDIVAKKLKFSYRILRVRDNLYGVLAVNGTWSGLMNPLSRKEADTALPTLMPSLTRRRILEISSPISGAISQFVVRRPMAVIDYNTYILPFSASVWIFLLIGCFVAFVSLEAAAVSTDDTSDVEDNAIKWTSKEILLAILSAATLRSITDQLPRRASIRIVLFAFILLSMLLAIGYSSVLVAFLTVERNQLPFNTLQGLVDNNDYNVGHMDSVAFAELLAPTDGNPNDIFAKLQRKARTHSTNYVDDNKQGIDKAFAEKYVFFSWVDGIAATMGQNCSFVITSFDSHFERRYYGLPFPRGSPHLEPVTRAVMSLRENGILDYLHRKYFPPFDSFCGSEERSHQTSLGIVHVTPIFYVLATGLLIAIVALIFELICFRYHNRKKGQLDNQQ